MSDVELALGALQAKQAAHGKAWNYYEGRHPLVYSSGRLKQVFRRLDARFTCNWCSVAVDAVFERLRLRGLEAPGAEGTMARVWRASGLALEADEVHRSALVTGEAFLMLGKEAGGSVEAYYHDPRQAHVFYDPEHPRRKVMAAKWWREADGTGLLLAYPDRIERYRQRGAGEPSASRFEVVSVEENGLGEVPMFHFRRDARGAVGELASLYDLQDAVNKLLNDMMIGSEFGVFAQRFVVSNAEVGTLKNSPSEIWHIPAGDKQDESTQIGQFAPVPLSHFLEPMAELASAMAVISGTPKHYFLRQGGDPSGEALHAMEARLTKKVERLIGRFSPVWAEVGRCLLRLEGISSEVEAQFEPAHSLSPVERARLRETNVRAGMSLSDHLRLEEGWSLERLASLEGVGDGV